ncbi:hypothetical protein Sjap_024871 [Stephania japonica]|uniref:GATA-type domain-containing protein n=1 Tax=Stephania japonica TaxID=461633 RepID=A0AAP0HLX7_9MAGN
MVSASTDQGHRGRQFDQDYHDHHHGFSDKLLGLDGKRPRTIADNNNNNNKKKSQQEDQQMVMMVYRRRAQPQQQQQQQQQQHITSVDHPTQVTQQGVITHKFCVDCKTTQTPLWRNGPSGGKSLCNACGIRYRKQRRKAEMEMKKNNRGCVKVVGEKRGVLESGQRFEEAEETEAALLLLALSWS